MWNSFDMMWKHMDSTFIKIAKKDDGFRNNLKHEKPYIGVYIKLLWTKDFYGFVNQLLDFFDKNIGVLKCCSKH
jgi:hypothetical protein